MAQSSLTQSLQPGALLGRGAEDGQASTRWAEYSNLAKEGRRGPDWRPRTSSLVLLLNTCFQIYSHSRLKARV